jgi:hypothetical protein
MGRLADQSQTIRGGHIANERGDGLARVGNLRVVIVFQKRGRREAGPAWHAGSMGECLLSYHGLENNTRLYP